MIVDSLGDNWRRFLFLGAALLALFLLPLPTLAKDSSIDSINLTNSSPPTPAHHFKFKQKINPVWWFENADEPAAPAWYEPGKHNRNLDWHMRNPFHNFDAYVIGVSDKPFTRSGRFPKNVFNPNGGWNWAVCHYKVWQLPFIAYDHKRVSFYLGWRERGNFGIKLNLASKKQASSAQARKGLLPDAKSMHKVEG